MQETYDIGTQSLTIQISGVTRDQIAIVLSHELRGRPCTVWLADVELDDNNDVLLNSNGRARVTPHPILIFKGVMSGNITVQDDSPFSSTSPTSLVTINSTSKTVIMNETTPVRNTVDSHRDFLRRSGAGAGQLDDQFFNFVQKLSERPIRLLYDIQGSQGDD